MQSTDSELRGGAMVRQRQSTDSELHHRFSQGRATRVVVLYTANFTVGWWRWTQFLSLSLSQTGSLSLSQSFTGFRDLGIWFFSFDLRGRGTTTSFPLMLSFYFYYFFFLIFLILIPKKKKKEKKEGSKTASFYSFWR